ncbi:DUF3868 domain-containing protein, partial [Porphyromonas loveana]|uniref:DUF3868 domain-containing protein n=1 Tax=Porphyromonas loveana TaxID=1884669 RepID=UPI0035A0F4EE
MKLSRYIILSLLVGASALVLSAQQNHLSGIQVPEKHVIKKKGRTAEVKMNLDLTAMPDMKSNLLMVVTPVIQSNTSGEQVALRPFVLAGNKRYRIVDRRVSLNKKHPFNNHETKPAAVVNRRNGKAQNLDYATTTPYHPWMRNSSL